jgi:hypothetical protein
MSEDAAGPKAAALDDLGQSTKAMLGPSQTSSAELLGSGTGGGGSGRDVAGAVSRAHARAGKAADGKDGGKKKKEEAKEKIPQVSYFSLYRFATWSELVLVIVGALSALAAGALQPLSIVVFGDIIDAFNPFTDLMAAIRTSSLQMVVLGAISFVCASTQVMCFVYTGSHQANRIRSLYFKAILRQEMAWYDGGATGELTTRISGYVRGGTRAGTSPSSLTYAHLVSVCVHARGRGGWG